MTGLDRGLCNEAFRLVADMERDRSSAEKLSRAIRLICLADDVWNESKDALAVQELLEVLDEHLKAIEDARGKLFRLLHPSREDFEREGWPDEDHPKEVAA